MNKPTTGKNELDKRTTEAVHNIRESFLQSTLGTLLINL